ncbi:DUF6516 family protein [Promineifilum sp.]|uniref:toxin-antitoxin system TumE family protein n=1 Tax=Promineifilum sp. TaxID=2664178 RepID=UPI0035ADA3A3
MKAGEHLERVEKYIVDNKLIKASQTRERRVRRFEAYIKIRLTLIDDSILDVTEYIYAIDENDAQVKRYSYHWMDSSSQLRLRWDNVSHYPKLPGFPHHLHDRAEKHVVSSESMTLPKALDRIAQEIESFRNQQQL